MKKILIVIVVGALGVGLWLVTRTLLRHAAADLLPDLPGLEGQPAAIAKHLEERDAAARDAPEDAAIVGRLCMAYHADVFYDHAAACYTRAVELAPGDWRWKYYQALLDEELGAAGRVLERLREVTGLHPDFAPAWYRLGRAALKRGDLDEAERAYKRAIAAGSDPSREAQERGPRSRTFAVATYATYGLARVQLQRKQLTEAARLLGDLTDRRPEFGPAHRLLGRVREGLGQKAEAEASTRRAAGLSPYHPPADPMVDALARESRSSTFLLKQVGVAQNSRNGVWAEYLARRAVKFNPEDADAVARLGRLLLLSLGRPREALPFLVRYRQMNPTDHQTLNNVCALLNGYGFGEEAEKHCREAIKVKPDCAEAYANLGMVLSARGQMEEALAQIGKAIDIKPDDAEILTNSGTVAGRAGRVEEALAYYRRALVVDPASAAAHLGQGVLQASRGQWHEAVGHYQKALELNPREVQAAERLAWLLATCPVTTIRDGEEAVRLAERASRALHDRNYRFLDTLAAAYAETGDFDAAVETARRAVQMAKTAGQAGLVTIMKRRLMAYEDKKPHRAGPAP